jgi:hypothetical protein
VGVFFLTAVVTDSTAISTVALFCLLISVIALCSDLLIENGPVTPSFTAPRDNQLK